jgi:poly-D-alanine transfer protein DltD
LGSALRVLSDQRKTNEEEENELKAALAQSQKIEEEKENLKKQILKQKKKEKIKKKLKEREKLREALILKTKAEEQVSLKLTLNQFDFRCLL